VGCLRECGSRWSIITSERRGATFPNTGRTTVCCSSTSSRSSAGTRSRGREAVGDPTEDGIQATRTRAAVRALKDSNAFAVTKRLRVGHPGGSVTDAGSPGPTSLIATTVKV
jgi:hypothetical protein